MVNILAVVVVVLLLAALVFVCIRIYDGDDPVPTPVAAQRMIPVAQSTVPRSVVCREDPQGDRKTGETVAPFISRGEAECGRVLKLLFPRHSFQTRVRPRWLMNDFPGRRTVPKPLELDYFCEELKLALEYNGEQHRRLVPRFHGTDEHAPSRLQAQLLRDAMKARKCRERGVDLIVVWYDLELSDIERFLRQHSFVIKRMHSFF
jgi:hypothetical protein